MALFHAYNKFDSMDLIHVSAMTEEDALSIAIADGFLTGRLAVPEEDIVVHPFSHGDQTSDLVRRVNSSGVECWGRP